jgi:hypothetical protein
MDMPHSELLSPMPVLDTVSEGSGDARVVAVYGRARGLVHLHQSQRLEFLWISGVDVRSAEVVGQIPALRRLVVHDLRMADLRAFSSLRCLQDLAIVGSPRLKSLDGIEDLRALRRLILFGNCNYGGVAQLALLGDLETLCLEGGVSKSLRLPTLGPLEQLRSLRRLRLASIQVADRSLRPLYSLSSLREVFIAKTFPPGELRALAMALPEAHGEFLNSYRGPG